MDAGRTYEMLGSETKDFITYSNGSSLSMSIYAGSSSPGPMQRGSGNTYTQGGFHYIGNLKYL